MFTNPMRNDNSAVKNIDELLSCIDEQFVCKAFLALLSGQIAKRVFKGNNYCATVSLG